MTPTSPAEISDHEPGSAPSAMAERAMLRPRARGWIHLYSALVAVAMGVTFIAVSAATAGGRAALAVTIYVITIIGLFAVSATYHRHVWVSERTRRWMKRADHSMIFIFIAGTYTPFALLALPPDTATIILIIVWVGALGGVALKMGWPQAPRWVGVPFYLALGWVAVFIIPDILHGGGITALVLMLVGGALYSAGAVFYAIRRPRGWPATFGYHEFFHAFVTAAALCHCIAIWFLVYA